MGPETVVLDFPKRAVREPIPDEKFRYGFEIAPELVRTVLRDDEPDWVNTIFLSTRFKAWRVGGYNEYLYTFFKCLTDERIAYADGWFAEAHDDTSTITLDGWEVQRRCPHLKADLSKFGVVEGTTLTCNLHGWQWDLKIRDVPDHARATNCAARKTHDPAAAAVLRRRPGPTRPPCTDLAALSLSLGHGESHSAAVDQGLPGRAARACGAAVPDLGQFGSAALAAAGRPPAAEVHTGHPRRAGHLAQPGVHPGEPETSWRCSTRCSSAA